MDTELLAPAGDKEAAYSAFYFGADAVYLGLKSFSARAEAVNFSESDLDEITAFAHSKGKKVYVFYENKNRQLWNVGDVWRLKKRKGGKSKIRRFLCEN